ncbi:MaoC family dehydratase [Shimia biformata]|uniref:MaoC family dehydratase n=1 Tax=Shimia biformata TaxID=1294299 RepID=UPI001951C3D6|nr:MaoC family dehydratase [Shimia biformata]
MIALVKNLADSVGIEIGMSSWVVVDQPMIDTFADTTGDRQFIHLDPEAAAEAGFGGTIAHGFLTLSLLPAMIAECVRRPDLTGTGVNYGLDHIRFLSPVRAGSRIRGRFVLADYAEPKPGTRKLTWNVTVEIEDSEKPALVAQWHTLRHDAVKPA